MALTPWNELVGPWNIQAYPWVSAADVVPVDSETGIILISSEFAVDGARFALPGSRETILSWEVATLSGTNDVTVRLLGSLRGIDFELIDTIVGQDLKTLITGIHFIQAVLVSNPTLTFVTVRAKVTF